MRDAVLTPLAFAWATTLCALLALLEGCAQLKPSGDTPDAGPACAHRQPPGRPEVKDAGGILDLTLAVSLGDLGTSGSLDDAGRPRYQNLGFDLDNTCTGEGQEPSCIEPPSVPKSHYQDGVDGIDNAFGMGWYKYAGDIVTPEPNAVEGLIRVRYYNGMPNDDQVEVSIYYALGLSARDDGGVGFWPPVWDGQDRWNILPESLESPEAGASSLDNPKYVDKNAYVSNGVLVTRLDDALSLSYLTSAPTHLWKAHRVVIAGTLSQAQDGTWELQAMAGSRAKINEAVQATLLEIATGSNYPICLTPDAGTYVQRVCSFADIAYDDDTGSAMCDATSTGYALQAKQARLGEVAGPLQEYVPCDLDAYTCDLVDP